MKKFIFAMVAVMVMAFTSCDNSTSNANVANASISNDSDSIQMDSDTTVVDSIVK